jgi:hypothetical protein
LKLPGLSDEQKAVIEQAIKDVKKNVEQTPSYVTKDELMDILQEFGSKLRATLPAQS